MKGKRPVLAAAAALALAGPSAADIVRLASGSVLEGVVRDGGDGETIVVEMRVGTCRVRRAQVASIESKPYDRPAPGNGTEATARVTAPAPETAPAADPEAVIGLFDDGAGPALPLLAPPPAAGARAAAPAQPPAPADAEVRAWILAAAAPDGPATEDARQRLAGLPPDALRAHATRALRNLEPGVRRAGALALRASKDPAAIPTLSRRAMVETDAKVLRAIAGSLGDPAGWAASYFADRLASGDWMTRARAAEVLGWTGDARWLPLLVRRYRIIWGCTNRGNCVLSNQLRYVPDYDIELAAGVAIPDPKVGVVQDGVVLDAKVLKVEEEGWWTERVAFHDALVRLAGTDAGPRPEDWQRWLAASPKKP